MVSEPQIHSTSFRLTHTSTAGLDQAGRGVVVAEAPSRRQLFEVDGYVAPPPSGSTLSDGAIAGIIIVVL